MSARKSTETKTERDRLLFQLRRIRGQVDGVIRMYEDERSCTDIVRQIAALRNASARVARELLNQEASRCNKERRVEDLDEVIKELFRY